MNERNPVTSDDLRAAARLVAESIRKLDADLYEKLAYGLEWTRSATAAHIASALFHYSAALSRKSTDNPETRGLGLVEGSIAAATWQIESNAEVLALVAESMPAEVRGYHRTGNPDVEGFLAMGCVEVLLHGHDAVVGTDAEFDPDDEMCRRILGRLFPWAPLDHGGWLTLLWATGRGDIVSREHLGDTWMWHNDLLSEWDGKVPDSTIWITRN
jgi:hypothetical protein